MKGLKKLAGWGLLMLGTVAVLTIMVLIVVGMFNNRIEFAQSNHEKREAQRIEEILEARLEPPKPNVQSVKWQDSADGIKDGQVEWKDDIDRSGSLSFTVKEHTAIEFPEDDLNRYPLDEHLTYFENEIVKNLQLNQ